MPDLWNELAGLLMSEIIMFSLPKRLPKRRARPEPSWPRPPVMRTLGPVDEEAWREKLLSRLAGLLRSKSFVREAVAGMVRF